MVWNTNWGQTNLFLVARTNPFDERREHCIEKMAYVLAEME